MHFLIRAARRRDRPCGGIVYLEREEDCASARGDADDRRDRRDRAGWRSCLRVSRSVQGRLHDVAYERSIRRRVVSS